MRAACRGRARTSLYNKQYLTLDLDLGDGVVSNVSNDDTVISRVMKGRAKFTGLNYNLGSLTFRLCSLCKLARERVINKIKLLTIGSLD